MFIVNFVKFPTFFIENLRANAPVGGELKNKISIQLTVGRTECTDKIDLIHIFHLFRHQLEGVL